MSQTAESVQKADASEVSKKKKARKRSKINNGDIGPILDALGDDITIASEMETVNNRRNSQATGARKIPVINSHGDGVHKFPESNLAPNVYLENRSGFRAQPLKDYEKNISTKQQKESIAKLKSQDKQRLINMSNNPGLYFVVKIHETLQMLSFTLFGVLAGASLVHTLFVQALANAIQIGSSTNQYYLLLRLYGAYARPVSITFYASLAVVGVFIFGKFDLGRPTINCIQKCVRLQNGLMAIIFYMLCFIINNSMSWFDNVLHTTSYKSDTQINYLLNTDSELNSSLKIWLILDAGRTALILITWISVGLGDPLYDRLVKTLSSSPTGDGRRDGDMKNEGQIRSNTE
uniref:Transmembrane protein n=1 Tax=Trichobilharzia regenti TaxID=157069 RepID=A0AA85JRY2_TRIRE|nr:unnamed protein product [Trichobilharzia regenti]